MRNLELKKKKKEEWLDDNNMFPQREEISTARETETSSSESFGMLCMLLHAAATARGGNARGGPRKCGVWSITGRASL